MTDNLDKFHLVLFSPPSSHTYPCRRILVTFNDPFSSHRRGGRMTQFNTTKRKLHPENDFARIIKKLLSDCHSIEFHCIPQVIICKPVFLSSSSWVPDRYFVLQIGNYPCTRLTFLDAFCRLLAAFHCSCYRCYFASTCFWDVVCLLVCLFV